MSEGQQRVNEWAKRHQAFLELVYDHFAKTGSWPKVDALQRQRFRAGDESDLRASALALPRGVGWLDAHGGQVYLTFRGLSFCPSARPLLDAVVRVVQLAVDRFRCSDENPTIDSPDVPEQLGLDEATVQRVGLVINNEPFLGMGLRSSGDGPWTWEIPLEITKFARVTTIEDYLKVQMQMLQQNAEAQRTWPFDPLVAPVPAESDDLPNLTVSTPLSLQFDDLDPLIRGACQKLFEGGHFQQGVVAATSALRDLVRSQSGLKLDGDALMGKALGGSAPCIVVADSSTETGRNIQRGVLSLAQGIMAGLRNPLVHETVILQPHEAMEMVAAISLVARWIQTGPFTSRTDQNLSTGEQP